MSSHHVTLFNVKPELFAGYPALEHKLGYAFKNPAWLCEALTHRSALVCEGFSEEALSQDRPWNERLEFLGDSVLGLVITEQLSNRDRSLSEGDMSRIRASIVCEESLAAIACKQLNLGKVLVLGASELRSAGRDKPSLLADALEAVIGAVFTDGGWESAKTLVLRLFAEVLTEDLDGLLERDHKTLFQEVVQAKFRATPTYDVVAESGPAHCRLFEVAVFVERDGIREEWGRGKGKTKKRAAQEAALRANARIKEVPEL